MKIPARLKAMGATVKVLRPESIIIEGYNCAGSWEPDTLTIEIRRDLEGDAAELALFHEILHVCDLNGALNEAQTHQIARALYAVLKDNHLLRE